MNPETESNREKPENETQPAGVDALAAAETTAVETAEDSASEAASAAEGQAADAAEVAEAAAEVAEETAEVAEAAAEDAADEVAAAAAATSAVASAAAAKAVATARKKRGRGAKKKTKSKTLGQQLAADMDRKAAEKAAKRGQEAEQIEEAAEEMAEEVSSWFVDHGRTLLLAVAAVVIFGVGTALWSNHQQTSGLSRTSELDKAVASVLEAEEANPASASTAFGDVADQTAGTIVGDWATLGKAQQLLAAGETDSASAEFKKITGSEEAHVAASAFEGLGYAAEANKDWPKASEYFSALAKVGGAKTAHEVQSQYHLARLALAQGKRDEAVSKLNAALETLNKNTTTQDFLREQVATALRALGEEADVKYGAGAMPSIPMELLQQLQGK